ncbi:MAG: hypothetical protein WEB52_06500 [Dehalococcoidia bacterium]
MEPQQLATKVTQLESRVATLEDEGKIIKGEVKQILTEIRSAILVRENPFEMENARGMAAGGTTHVISTAPSATKVELVMPSAPEPAPVAEPQPEFEPAPARTPYIPEPSKEPVMLRPQAHIAPSEPDRPQWSLLTVAGLSAWAEEAMRRLGPLRLEILLDLCEAAGHLTPDARTALSRITEMDTAEPAQAPSTNDTVVILRQLEALVNDDQDYGSRLQRHA